MTYDILASLGTMIQTNWIIAETINYIRTFNWD